MSYDNFWQINLLKDLFQAFPSSVLSWASGGQLDAGKQIDIIYLDMSKAFDEVDHIKLLGRLY